MVCVVRCDKDDRQCVEMSYGYKKESSIIITDGLMIGLEDLIKM